MAQKGGLHTKLFSFFNFFFWRKAVMLRFITFKFYLHKFG